MWVPAAAQPTLLDSPVFMGPGSPRARRPGWHPDL